MQLKVGMYVRTNFRREHVIRKVVNIVEDKLNHDHLIIFDKPTKYNYYIEDNNYIAKENIIDLIEVGDILEINKEKYEVIYDDSFEKLGILIPSRKALEITHSALKYVFKKFNVSIVTKEQFESMKYEVK